MNFTQAVKYCFANYVKFDGRASRSEYWYWTLFYILALIAGAILAGFSVVASGNSSGLLIVILAIGAFALFVPTLAVSVRRFHDLDCSGWWFLVSFVPYVGSIGLIIWFLLPGTEGANRFGPNPLASRSDVGDGGTTQASSIPRVNRDD